MCIFRLYDVKNALPQSGWVHLNLYSPKKNRIKLAKAPLKILVLVDDLFDRPCTLNSLVDAIKQRKFTYTLPHHAKAACNKAFLII